MNWPNSMSWPSSMSWPKWLGPMPGRREAHVMAWMALIAGVILCITSVLLGFHGRTFMGRPLGGDFVEFYTVGKILNTYPPARIYDLALAVRLQHETLPTMADTQMLVFGQSPYIGWLFRPFALLPYAWAYVAWLGFTAALYLAGLATLFAAVRLKPEDRKTGYLLALSWAPFLFETWIGGQMAAFVFFVWALFFWLIQNERRFAAGLVLSLCLFKPTLVALPAVMLLVSRRWRAASGLAVGGGAMVLASFFTVGWQGFRAWAAVLAYQGEVAVGPGDAWHRAKSVDMSAFFHLLLGNSQPLTSIVLILIGIAAVGLLGRAWWYNGNGPATNELWAATLCFTLVVNAYAPIYDSVVVVVAVALLASGDWSVRPEKDREAFAVWILLLYMLPWLTQAFAEFLHFQLITLVLAGFGGWALRLVSRSDVTLWSQPKTEQEESTIPHHLQPRVAGRL